MKQIYSYDCTACGHVFEEIKEVEERHECSPCPQCGGQTRKIISPGIRGVVNGSARKGNYGSGDLS